ncbi:MAG: DUF1697 domain-containing protein [Bauldia sp.]|nr:DUF1697 domain-containing protein [Bauldia sp.]
MTNRSATYVVLPRGINVGGKNKVGMADLKKHLEAAGFENVVSHSLAGNLIVDSPLASDAVSAKVEKLLDAKFKLDRDVMVVAIERKAFARIVAAAPKEFGADDAKYRYYVLFLKDITAKAAMKDVEVRPEIDAAWTGPGAIYFRLPSLKSGLATKSWLNRITQKPLYQKVTMRNWATTKKIAQILEKAESTP